MTNEFQHKVFNALQPPATMIDDDILFWKPFDTAPIVYYVRFFEECACKINVKAAHDANAVLALLRDMSPVQLDAVNEAMPLAISNSGALKNSQLQLRVVVHASLAGGGLSKATEFMKPTTYGVFPAYRCEFTDNDTRDESAFRLAKVVPWSDWGRQPAPALSARYLRQKTGIKSTGGKRMGIFRLEEVERILTYIGTDDGFVDIENYQRLLAHVEHAAGRYEVQQGNDRWVLRAEAATEWLRVFAIDGVDTADEKRGDYVA